MSSRSELLNVLSEVKTRVQDKLGIVDFPMPQFIIIGSQSVGKSRLIEAMAGEQFNFISGTLGSRRPTVLEFRNVKTAEGGSKWSILDKKTGQWQTRETAEVMKIVGEAHESLGASVSHEAIHVRVESSMCVDMQIVDLPGYRSFASDEAGRKLMSQIESLNATFINDPRNVIICVEEAGDAANMSSLRRVSQVDKDYKRSILVRNKLDKYYGDLDSNMVNKWLDGMGDLPKNLKKFALTLPHWSSELEMAPRPLSEMRQEFAQQDMNKFASLGTSSAFLATVGFSNFSKYMEQRTERMFVEAIGPVLSKLRALESSMTSRDEELKEELDNSDPRQILSLVRACGMSFANCLTHIMEGSIRSETNRMTLGDELRAFHDYHRVLGDATRFEALPSSDFGGIEDYIDYLKDDIQVPTFEVAINGGAQYSRLMFEVETFLRFSEVGMETKKKDVLQSFGISMGSVTWSDVIVKLLTHVAHLPLRNRIAYVAERVKWFFMQQKEPIVEFMKGLKGSSEEKLFSSLYAKHAKLIEENQTIKKLVFDTFDTVVQRQLVCFESLFKSTLQATFSNPFVFLKKTTARLEDCAGEEVVLPSLEDTKARIPKEIRSRTGIERTVQRWIGEVPLEPHKIDDAVDKVQLLVLKVYSHIRSQVCDQVELFCESFFKLPLLRRLEEDMNLITLSEVDESGFLSRRAKLEKETAANVHALKEVQECLKTLTKFQLKTMAAHHA
mmetsp:Transcript_9918/g.21610  ORF Transcript_9918/g.21610 Transcript_9918/m.21610 type:complete len:728 (-) Transcript_9918:14-2197(-)